MTTEQDTAVLQNHRANCPVTQGITVLTGFNVSYHEMRYTVMLDESTVTGCTGIEAGEIGENGNTERRSDGKDRTLINHRPPNPCTPVLHRPRWRTVTGQPASCRAAMKFPIGPLTGPDGCGPSKKRVSSAGNTSVTLSPESSCRAGATNGTEALYRFKFLTEVNRCKRSSHWVFSMSSCHFSGESRSFSM